MNMIEKINWIEDEIMEEIQGAKTYMKCAKSWEAIDSDISKTFKKMAQQEISHAEQLNLIAVKILHRHLDEAELQALPDLMEKINTEQIKEAKNYVPDADPEPTPTTVAQKI